MEHFNKNTIILIVSFALVSGQFQSGAYAASPINPKAACRIEIDNAHISASLLKNRQLRFIKINARSICNVPQSQVTLSVEIHKTTTFGDRLVRTFTSKPSAIKQQSIEIKDAAILCTNNKKTRWYGIAYSKALIYDKWHYAGRTFSKLFISLECGT
jgi:hypothetical protein